MQAAGDGVGVGVELAAGVQDRHDHLDGGPLLLGVHLDRDAAAVVVNRHPAVGPQRHDDVVGVTGHRLVHRVVDDFLVSGGAARARRWNRLHAGALADRVQALQHGDGGRAVLVLLVVTGLLVAPALAHRPDTPRTRSYLPGEHTGLPAAAGSPTARCNREVPTARTVRVLGASRIEVALEIRQRRPQGPLRRKPS